MKKIISKIFLNTFVQANIIVSFTYFILGLINYLFNVIAGRVLGPSGYGEITAFLSYLNFFSLPIGIVGLTVTIKVGKQKERELYIRKIYTWIITKVKEYFFIFLLVVPVIPFMPVITNLNPILAYAIIPFTFVSSVSFLYDSVLQVLEKFTLYSILSIIPTFIKFVGVVIAMYFFPHLETVFIFLMLSMLFKLFSSYWYLRPLWQPLKTQFDKKILHIFFDRDLRLTAFFSVSVTIISSLDMIVSKHVLSADEAGVFSAWSLYAKTILYVLGPVISVSFIYFANSNDELKRRIYFLGTLIFLSFSSAVAFIIYSNYQQLLVDLIFGKKYYLLIPYMNWAAIYGILFMLITYINNYYLSIKSKASMLLFITMPFYATCLFLWGRTLSSLMIINIGYASLVVVLFGLVFVTSRIQLLLEQNTSDE